MTEEKDEDTALDRAWEALHDKYQTDEGEFIEYDVEDAELAERLYKALAFEILKEEGEFEYKWVLEKFTLMRIYQDIYSTIERMKGKDNWENQIRLMTSDDVVLFFTLSDELISGVAGKILDDKIVSESKRSDASLNSMTDLDHRAQMDVLYYIDVIDEGLKGELTNIHKTRNKLIHNLRQRHFLEGLNNIKSRLDRALTAINDLHEIAEGHKPFDHL